MESTKNRINTYFDETCLAYAKDEDQTEHVELRKISFPWDSYHFVNKTFFVVSHRQMDEYNEYDKFFSDFADAYKAFTEETGKTFRYGGDTEDHKVYTDIDTTFEYREYVNDMECEDDEPYTPSATYGDYGPSNPWNAPGMSVSDFLPGVY